MGEPIFDPSWSGLLLDWELAESSSSQQDAGSCTLTTEEGEVLSKCEGSNKGLSLNYYNRSNSPNMAALINSHSTALDKASNSFPSHHTSNHSTLKTSSPMESTLTSPRLLHSVNSAPLNGRERVVKEDAHNNILFSGLSSVSSKGNGGQAIASIELEDVLGQTHTTSVERLDAKLHLVTNANSFPLPSASHIGAPNCNHIGAPSCSHSTNSLTTMPKASSSIFPPSHTTIFQHHHHSSTTNGIISQQHTHHNLVSPISSIPALTTQHQQFQLAKSSTLSFSSPPSKQRHDYNHDSDYDCYSQASLEALFNSNFIPMEDSIDIEGDSSSTIYDEESISFGVNSYVHKKLKKRKIKDDSSTRHCLAERKRREKLNRNIEVLRAIVSPSLSIKTDKASIIAAAIKLLSERKEPDLPSSEPTISATSQLTNGQSTLIPNVNEVLQEGSYVPSNQGLDPIEKGGSQIPLSDVFCDLQATFELEMKGCVPFEVPLHKVQVNSKQVASKRQSYIISLRAPDKLNLFSDIVSALSSLNLEVIFANSCFTSMRSSFAASPQLITWFLSKVEVLDTISNLQGDKSQVIYEAIKNCIS